MKDCEVSAWTWRLIIIFGIAFYGWLGWLMLR
nr:MAG TPA: Sodium/potassium-transporting ATPase subunit alpha-1 [Caudoviricetes sp.]